MPQEVLAPVLRVGKTAEAVAWYQRLGFISEFEHSWGPGLNRTEAVLTRGELRLILSEGETEGRSDSVVCLGVADVGWVVKEFNVRAQKLFLREQVELQDPDGNRILVVELNKFTPSVGPESNPS